MRKSVADRQFGWDSQPFEASLSIGLLDLSEVETSADVQEVMRLVDIACYVAKARGRDRVQKASLSDCEQARYVDDALWGRRLKQALAHEQLRLHVQPIVSVHDSCSSTSGKVRGELLLRMFNHTGVDHVVPPSLFIPAAERYGLLIALDQWVIRTALQTIASLDETKFSEYSINLSATSIGDERFIDHILSEFARSKVDPKMICFELTETAAMSDLASASRFIRVNFRRWDAASRWKISVLACRLWDI